MQTFSEISTNIDFADVELTECHNDINAALAVNNYEGAQQHMAEFELLAEKIASKFMLAQAQNNTFDLELS